MMLVVWERMTGGIFLFGEALSDMVLCFIYYMRFSMYRVHMAPIYGRFLLLWYTSSEKNDYVYSGYLANICSLFVTVENPNLMTRNVTKWFIDNILSYSKFKHSFILF